MSDWFKELFINEAKAAIDSRGTGGGSDDPSNQPQYDFGKTQYLTLHDLKPFAVSDPVLNLGAHGGNYQQMYINTYAVNNTVEHLTVNFADTITTFRFTFNSSSARDNRIKQLTLHFAPNATPATAYSMFYHCNALEVIDGTPLNFSGTDKNNCDLVGCFALREIRFAPNCVHINLWFGNSSLLSEESLQSIIDGFEDLTGSDAKTLTLHSTTLSKVTPEQFEASAAKNWTIQ